MALEMIDTKQNTYESLGEGQYRPLRGNRRGELVVCDFWTQLVLDGRMFHLQIGTESTPVNATIDIADTLVWALVDGTAGTTILPAMYEESFDLITDATDVDVMFEIDRAKNRWISGGSSFVPTNLRTDTPRVSVATKAYVGTDITTAAKTAVPGSIEMGHHKFFEDNIATGTGNAFHKYVLNGRKRPLGVIVGVGSMLGHFGCATATNDTTGFGSMEWAEIPTTAVV